MKPCSGVGGSAPTSPCGIAHCPKCQSLARAEWVEKRKTEVLDCPYFHVVFTLPEDIAALAYQNKDLVYGILFRATARPCLPSRPIPNIGRRDRLLRRASHLGTEPAFSSPLALCGPGRRNLARWYPLGSLPPGFFLPVRVLSRLFRRLFLTYLQEAFDADQLHFFSA